MGKISKIKLPGEPNTYDIGVSWENVINKPTTLAGYGIINSYTKSQVDIIAASEQSEGQVLYPAAGEDGIVYENEATAANNNHLLVFFGTVSSTSNNLSLGLPALTPNEYGKVYHIEITFEKVVMSSSNGVKFFEVDNSGAVTAYTPYYQHAPVVEGETVSFDYTMSSENITIFRMRMYEQAGQQKIKVKVLLKKLNVEDYAYSKNQTNTLIENKQTKPIKEKAIPITWEDGKLIDINGNINNTSSNSYKVSNALTAYGGEVFRITTQMNYNNGIFVFTDVNGEVLQVTMNSGSGSTITPFSDIVTAPENSVSLYVGCYNPETTHGVTKIEYLTLNLKGYYDIADSLNNMVEEKYVEASDAETISGYMLSNKGVPIVASNYVVSITNVSDIEYIKISAKPYGTNYYCAFFDDENLALDPDNDVNTFTTDHLITSGSKRRATGDDESFYNTIIPVPTGAKQVIVSGTSSFAPEIFKMTGYELKKKWTGKKWTAIGDSVTEKNKTATKNYVDYIVEQTGIQVNNMGQSGSGYKQKESSNQAFYQRISDVPTDSDVVTIFGSFNDAGYIYNMIDVSWNSTPQQIIDATGAIVSGGMNSSYVVSNAIEVTPNKYYRIKTRMKGPNAFFVFKDINNEVLYVEKVVDENGVYPTDYSTSFDYDGYMKAPKYAKYLYVASSINGDNSYTYIAEDNLGMIDDTNTNTICGCINTTINNLYTIMPTVNLGIISSIPWTQYNAYNSPSCIIYIEALENICKKRGIPFLNLFYESNLRPWEQDFLNLTYKHGNNDHPDEDAHKLFASRIEAFLDTLLLH